MATSFQHVLFVIARCYSLIIYNEYSCPVTPPPSLPLNHHTPPRRTPNLDGLTPATRRSLRRRQLNSPPLSLTPTQSVPCRNQSPSSLILNRPHREIRRRVFFDELQQRSDTLPCAGKVIAMHMRDKIILLIVPRIID